jgi:hypothetical protein
VHKWSNEYIDRVLHDPEVRIICGDALVLVASDDTLGARPLSELPDELTAWFAAEDIPFPAEAVDAAGHGLVTALVGEGVPFVYLAPNEIRLAVYDGGQLGPWLWSYSENCW